MTQVFIKAGGITLVALVSDNMQPVFEKIRGTFMCSDFFLTWNGKPLTVLSSPIELGMPYGATLMCTIRLRGGSVTGADNGAVLTQPEVFITNPLFCTEIPGRKRR
jgi:hypothetical protein